MGDALLDRLSALHLPPEGRRDRVHAGSDPARRLRQAPRHAPPGGGRPVRGGRRPAPQRGFADGCGDGAGRVGRHYPRPSAGWTLGRRPRVDRRRPRGPRGNRRRALRPRPGAGGEEPRPPPGGARPAGLLALQPDAAPDRHPCRAGHQHRRLLPDPGSGCGDRPARGLHRADRARRVRQDARRRLRAARRRPAGLHQRRPRLGEQAAAGDRGKRRARRSRRRPPRRQERSH